MSVVRQEYINKACNALFNLQTNSFAQRERFRSANYGENTPIDSKMLDDVPRGKVVLSKYVFDQLLKVNDESEKAKSEFAYFLTGDEEGQTVKFDNILWCRNVQNSREADFTPLVPYLNEYVGNIKSSGKTNAIVCNGHTHPKCLSGYAEDFSIYDMAGFIQMKEENSVFRDGTIELCGGILSDLNFNFCFYDRNMQNFYKFSDVVVELESGEQIPLSCYGRKVSREDVINKVEKRNNPFFQSLRNSVVQRPTYTSVLGTDNVARGRRNRGINYNRYNE